MKLILFVLFAIQSMSIHAQAQSRSTKKVLVVYYSHTGNTRTVAEEIHRAAGGDIFEIVPVSAYPKEHQAVVDQSKKEIEAGHQPALTAKVADMKQYDVIFVGSPCWWATIAPPVATFLASYDFSGKTIVPFMTHEGSRMGHSEDDIRKLCPKSDVQKGLPVRGSSAGNAQGDISKWLERLNIGV